MTFGPDSSHLHSHHAGGCSSGNPPRPAEPLPGAPSHQWRPDPRPAGDQRSGEHVHSVCSDIQTTHLSTLRLSHDWTHYIHHWWRDAPSAWRLRPSTTTTTRGRCSCRGASTTGWDLRGLIGKAGSVKSLWTFLKSVLLMKSIQPVSQFTS